MILPLETEIKIRIPSIEAVRKRLRDLGYKVHEQRVFESNTLFDTPDRRLSGRGELVRIRRAGRATLVTFKGPSQGGDGAHKSGDGAHKNREEIQTTAGDAAAMEEIFGRLGLRPSFHYEKYRTEYSRQGSGGIITVDETPIGDYLEIEGVPEWIDDTASELGYSRSEYITTSYGGLYAEYCREHGIEPSNMEFESSITGEPLTGKDKSP